MTKKFLSVFGLICLLQGCTSTPPELKSPCVGAEGSPCGPRLPVNQQWVKQELPWLV